MKTKALRVIYDVLGAVEFAVDAYGWVKRKLSRKPRPRIDDLDRTYPLPLRPRPSRPTERLPAPPRVPRV